jgi:hypothetical protein
MTAGGKDLSAQRWLYCEMMVGQVVEVGRQVVVVLVLVQYICGEWGWGLNLGLLGWQDGGVR